MGQKSLKSRNEHLWNSCSSHEGYFFPFRWERIKLPFVVVLRRCDGSHSNSLKLLFDHKIIWILWIQIIQSLSVSLLLGNKTAFLFDAPILIASILLLGRWVNTHFTDEETEAGGIGDVVEARRESSEQSSQPHGFKICSSLPCVVAQPSSLARLTVCARNARCRWAAPRASWIHTFLWLDWYNSSSSSRSFVQRGLISQAHMMKRKHQNNPLVSLAFRETFSWVTADVAVTGFSPLILFLLSFVLFYNFRGLTAALCGFFIIIIIISCQLR